MSCGNDTFEFNVNVLSILAISITPINATVAVAGPAVAAVEEGPSKVNVVLTAAGANKIAVIKLVRDLTGLGLKEAKDIADNGGNVKEGIDKEEAEKIKAQFEEAGATVELK